MVPAVLRRKLLTSARLDGTRGRRLFYFCSRILLARIPSASGRDRCSRSRTRRRPFHLPFTTGATRACKAPESGPEIKRNAFTQFDIVDGIRFAIGCPLSVLQLTAGCIDDCLRRLRGRLRQIPISRAPNENVIDSRR